MQKYKNYRVRCPCCGMLTWTSRFYKNYPITFYEQQSKGYAAGFNLFPVSTDQDARDAFKQHFIYVVLELLNQHLIDYSFFEELVGVVRSGRVTVRSCVGNINLRSPNRHVIGSVKCR